ncbi:MAG TPA: hypothetical protein VG538_02155, partial [Vicinamibacterales bacterium]|nr:hypothetical protein [Vicinamibacterales bacterium]
TAVTKSGSNHFHGALYDVERNSDWNPNSKTNILNGVPKPVSQERDWGYSIGGPIGKPGGNNKLFFFYAQEFEPRTEGNRVTSYRMPTALERAGDFSQTTDNNGRPYPYIKNPASSAPCTASNSAGCYAADGVVGRIPSGDLYSLGQRILNLYPLPNCPENCPTWTPDANYNFQVTSPIQHLLGWQPVVKLDYQMSEALRLSMKYSAWDQRNQVQYGTLPGFNDTEMYQPTVRTWAATADYSLNPTTFIEATYGQSLNKQTGCSLGLAGGPSFCTSALPVNDGASLAGAGLADWPFLFPDATIIDPRYYQFEALNAMQPPIWDGTRISKVPSFSWGNRISNAPPNIPYPGILNTSSTWDLTVNLTKVSGRHTWKTGVYTTSALKREPNGAGTSAALGSVNFQQDSVGTNPCDTSFGFANAATGCFSSYQQASSFVEVSYSYANVEGFVQDTWKVNNKLTLDYGVRLVHVGPASENLNQATNFLPDHWDQSAAPLLYDAGCANGVYPCKGTDRQARNPVTGEFLGPNSSVAIGTLVPGSGSPTNGLFLKNEGPIGSTAYRYPTLGAAPRFGFAYDLTGQQRFVLRGGSGVFITRPSITDLETGSNPPTASTVTVRYANLQSLGHGGLTTTPPPALRGVLYDSPLPYSVQWNGGVQVALPWSFVADVEYVGQHSWNEQQAVNINAVDLGSAFLPENQDPTLAPSATPGASAVLPDQMRAMRGYSGITQQMANGWETYHSIQLSFQRRFSRGLAFGFNDTIALLDRGNANLRLQHNPDGSYVVRSDQAEADELLGDGNPIAHTMKANFIWSLPHLDTGSSVRRIVGAVINDWQLSGVWSASTGSAYTVGESYQNGGSNTNLTGSPDYAARVVIVGDPGAGCGDDVYRQFNTAAFQGAQPGSVGLDSGTGYLRGCFSSVLDLAIARTVRLGGGRTVQFRLDMFNAPNQARITGRNTTMNLTSPSDPSTIINLPFDDSGAVLSNRVRPNQAGFGAVTSYQSPRSIQAQIRFAF